MYDLFPSRKPHKVRQSKHPLVLHPGLFPEKVEAHQGNKIGKEQRKATPAPHSLLRFRRRHERWVGEEQPVFLSDLPFVPSTELLHPPLCFPLRPLLELPLRSLAPCVLFNFCRWHCLPYVRRGEEIQHHLTAPRVGEELVYLPPPPPSSSLLPHLLPQHPLLLSPSWTPLQKVLSRLNGVRAPPALGRRQSPDVWLGVWKEKYPLLPTYKLSESDIYSDTPTFMETQPPSHRIIIAEPRTSSPYTYSRFPSCE